MNEYLEKLRVWQSCSLSINQCEKPCDDLYSIPSNVRNPRASVYVCHVCSSKTQHTDREREAHEMLELFSLAELRSEVFESLFNWAATFFEMGFLLELS